MSVDLYKLLGVSPSATPAELKDAYRRLAMKYHPDQNPGDETAEERFKEIAHAYEILSDPGRRRAYDRLHREGRTGGPSFESFGELFEVLNQVISAGLAGTGRTRRRAGDLRVTVRLTLEEVMTGVRRDVTVPRRRACIRCDGTGAEPGTELRTCEKCDGQGRRKVQQGFFSLLRDCDRCEGRGKVAITPCSRCDGSGGIDGTEILPVDVPAGVRDGEVLRWSGKGVASKVKREPSGDLLVEIDVADHRIFQREEQDLHMTLPISFTQASLGAKVEVPTLTGSVFMRVPPGTQSNRVLRLRGKGLPGIGGRPGGDQYVRLKVTSPDELKKHQEKLRGESQDESGRRDKIWRKVRDFFR